MVVRYTDRRGVGLLNRDAYDMAKLNDDEDQELVERLSYGLEQPRDVPRGAVFFFTSAGEGRHSKLIKLLCKAARFGAVRTVAYGVGKPLWASNDGQVAFEKSKIRTISAEEGRPASQEIQSATRSVGRLEKLAQEDAYLKAVEAGDTAIMQSLVDEAARRAGYNVGPVWHGSKSPLVGSRFERRFTRGLGGRMGFWFASKKEAADHFGRDGNDPTTSGFYLAVINPKEFHGYAEFVTAVKAMGRSTIEENVEALRRSLVRKGHDAVAIRGCTSDSGIERDDWAVFSPVQIKSAEAVIPDRKGQPIHPSDRFDPASTSFRR